MDRRELKALEIAARRKIVFQDGTWLVPSQTNNVRYQIHFKTEGTSCTCEDWLLRKTDCKHILAARLVAEREGGAKVVIDTDAPPVKPKYTQNWSAYNESQINEKRRFLSLLADLCKGLKEPLSKGGRPRTPISDIVFSCVFKIYSTVSSRRFGSDLLDAHERGYLSKPMHPNKINTSLESPELTAILKQLITTSSLPLKSVETSFATDASGFSTSRFVRWFDEKYGVHRSGHDWVKAHCCCGTTTHIVTAIEIVDRDAHDHTQFKPLVETTVQNFKIDEMSADKAYLSNENLEMINGLGGTAFVPFKSNSVIGEAGSVWEKMYLYYNFRREEFLKHYHRRSNVESVFSMVKAKFRDHVRSRTDVAMKNEVYCKFLCHNICVVIQSMCELGIEAQFCAKEKDKNAMV